MSDEAVSSVSLTPHSCPGCGSDVAPNLLCCPSCRRLVHAARLKELAAAADDSEDAGDLAGALSSWRDAAALLPPDSRQYSVIAGHIARLGRLVEAGPSPRGN